MEEYKEVYTFNLKRIRKKSGLNQKQVAERAGINQAQYSRIESGIDNPTLETINKISSSLKVEIWELFFRIDNDKFEGVVPLIHYVREFDPDGYKHLNWIIRLAVNQIKESKDQIVIERLEQLEEIRRKNN